MTAQDVLIVKRRNKIKNSLKVKSLANLGQQGRCWQFDVETFFEFLPSSGTFSGTF